MKQPSPERQVRYDRDPRGVETASKASASSPTVAPKPSKRRHWGRIVAAIITILIIIVLAYVLYLASIVAKISTKPLDLSGLAGDSTGRTNVLILGVGDPGHAGEQLSDTMMIASYNAKTQRLATMSIPRDLRVYVPGYGYSKINAANVYGGPQLAMQVVSNTFGIPIHYYIKTDFTGLKRLVDAVGGIDINVVDRLADPSFPCEDNQYLACGLVIEPGLTHMNGVLALQYARCRKGTCGNDFGRALRQQEVIAAIMKKALVWQVIMNPAKLIPVVTAVQQSIETNMSTSQLIRFGLAWQKAQKNDPIHLVLSTSPGGYLKSSGGSSDLVPADGTGAAMRERVQAIFTVPVQPGDLPQ